MTNWWIFYLIGLKEPKQDGCQTQDNKKNKLIKLRKRFTTPNQLLRKASNLPAMTERKFILNLSLHNTIKRILVTQPEQKTVRQLEIITRTAFDIPLTDKDYNPLGIRLTRKSTGQEINKKNDSTELQLSSFDFQDEEFIMVSVWRATSKGDACNDSLCKQLTLNDSTSSNMPQKRLILILCLHDRIKKIRITNPELRTARQLEITARIAYKIPLADLNNNPIEIKLTRKSTGQEINKRNDGTYLQLSSFDFQDEEFIMVSVWRATSKGDACNDSLCKQLTLNDSTSSNMPQKRLILRLCLHGRVKKIRITNPELRTVQQLESIARTAFKIPLLDENKNFIEIELTRRSTGEIINRREHFAIMYLSSFAFQDDEFIMVRVRIFQ